MVRNQRCPRFKWNEQKIEAARLLAMGRVSRDDVAEVVGVSPGTISRWKECQKYIGLIHKFVFRKDKPAELNRALKSIRESPYFTPNIEIIGD